MRVCLVVSLRVWGVRVSVCVSRCRGAWLALQRLVGLGEAWCTGIDPRVVEGPPQAAGFVAWDQGQGQFALTVFERPDTQSPGEWWAMCQSTATHLLVIAAWAFAIATGSSAAGLGPFGSAGPAAEVFFEDGNRAHVAQCLGDLAID